MLKLMDPKLPSKKEVEEHYLQGHALYRNWCPICIKARGKEREHKLDKDKERRLPEYSLDYCFLEMN